jgi:hypothetical protein
MKEITNLRARDVIITVATRGTKKNRTPLGTMLSKGGVVLVPAEAYVRRLQHLYNSGNQKAHANMLFPGLAHIAGTTDAGLISLMRAVLTVSQAGRNLHGLESIFLSCLQGLQSGGHGQMAVACLSAWARYTPGKRQWPLVIVDRKSNQLKYIPAQEASRALRPMNSRSLLQQSVWEILKSLENASVNLETQGKFQSEVNESDAQECKDKIEKWANIVNGLVAAAATLSAMAASASTRDNTIGFLASLLQLSSAVLTGIASLISTYGCTDQQEQVPQQPSQDQFPMDDPNEWAAWPGTNTGSNERPTTTSEPGDWNVPDPKNTIGEWSTGDPAEPPPDPDATPNPDDPGGEGPFNGWAMPNPDDSGDSHSVPPSVPWHKPNGDMPNPDDAGGGGPVSFPNGAVFLPASLLGAIGSRLTKTVSTQLVGVSNTDVATIQLSVDTSALGARAE